MVYKVERGIDEYGKEYVLINESVTIYVNESEEDGFVSAEYDEKLLTEQEVNELVDEFFTVVLETLKETNDN